MALRFLHPEGLPSDYTITLLFRLLPNTPEEPFAIWEILNKNNEPLVGVILDSESNIANMFLEFKLKPRKVGCCCRVRETNRKVFVISCRWRKNSDVLQQRLQKRVSDGHV